MTARPDLPAHVSAASQDAQRAWIETYDEALEDHGDEARAQSAADDALGAVEASTAPSGGDEA